MTCNGKRIIHLVVNDVGSQSIHLLKGLLLYLVLVVSFALGASNFSAGRADDLEGFDHCILEHMKGVASDTAAKSILKSCGRLYPEGYRVAISGTVYEERRDEFLVGNAVEVALLGPESFDEATRIVAAAQNSYDQLLGDALKNALSLEFEALDRERLRIEVSLAKLIERSQQMLSEIELAEQASASLNESTSKRITAAQDRIGSLQNAISRLQTEQADIKLSLESQMSTLEEEYLSEKSALSGGLSKAQSALDAAMRQVTAESENLLGQQQTVIADLERRRISAARSLKESRDATGPLRQEFLTNLKLEYINNHLKVLFRTTTHKYSPEFCLRVTNSGDLGIATFNIDILYNDTPLSQHQMYLSDLVLVSSAKRGLVEPTVENHYSETVHGLRPGDKWFLDGGLSPDDCTWFNSALARGDLLRLFESMGGLSYNASKWDVEIADARLAHPDSLVPYESRYSGKEWKYSDSPLESVFAAELAEQENVTGVEISSVAPIDAAYGIHRRAIVDISDVQRRLDNLGFDPGGIDGQLGPRTRTALRDFQASHDLTENGELDVSTLEALGMMAGDDEDVDNQVLASRSEIIDESRFRHPYQRSLVELHNSKIMLDEIQREISALREEHDRERATLSNKQEVTLAPLRAAADEAAANLNALAPPAYPVTEELVNIEMELETAKNDEIQNLEDIATAEQEIASKTEDVTRLLELHAEIVDELEEHQTSIASIEEQRADLINSRGDYFEKIRARSESSIDRSLVNEVLTNALNEMRAMTSGYRIKTAVSDIEGDFSFNDLAAGKYVLFAQTSFPRIDFRWWFTPVDTEQRTTWDLGPHNSLTEEQIPDGLIEY